MRNNLQPIKKTGKPQRNDVALTGEIANALGQIILDGGVLYSRTEPLAITVSDGGVEKSLVVSTGTLNAWISRENVIPETGMTLRAFLDGKRAEKRDVDDRAEQNRITRKAQSVIEEILNEPHTGGGTVTRKYKYVRNAETGEVERVLQGELETTYVGGNAKMVEAKGKVLTFALERLRSDLYGSKSETRNTHLVFSLADIQRIRENRNTDGGDA